MLADIGGTNIRLALHERPDDTRTSSVALSHVEKLQCANFDCLQSAIEHYLSRCIEGKLVTEACLAIAGPVGDDLVSMTNLDWSFSQSALKESLGLRSLAVLNDFEAVAYAIPELKDDEVIQIGGHHSVSGAPKLAIGPGTGLGVAIVLESANGNVVFPAEGGHATIAPQTKEERAAVEFHTVRQPGLQTPCREYFVSGRGLAAIYQALGGDENCAPADISAAAINAEDALSVQALDVFCGLLGSTCGDQALSCGSLGGVYIAGGMVKQFLEFLQKSEFRARFENKGAMREYLSHIPCFVITRNHVALLGAAAYEIQ